MPCRRCNKWVDNEWLFWLRRLDVFWNDSTAGWYFICDRCDADLRHTCGRCGAWKELWEQEHWKQCKVQRWPIGFYIESYILCEECQGNIESHNSVAATTESNLPVPDDILWLGRLEEFFPEAGEQSFMSHDES